MKKNIIWAIAWIFALWGGVLTGHTLSPSAYTMEANTVMLEQIAWYTNTIKAYESSTQRMCEALHTYDPGWSCVPNYMPPFPSSSLRYLP